MAIYKCASAFKALLCGGSDIGFDLNTHTCICICSIVYIYVCLCICRGCGGGLVSCRSLTS